MVIHAQEKCAVVPEDQKAYRNTQDGHLPEQGELGEPSEDRGGEIRVPRMRKVLMRERAPGGQTLS